MREEYIKTHAPMLQIVRYLRKQTSFVLMFAEKVCECGADSKVRHRELIVHYGIKIP